MLGSHSPYNRKSLRLNSCQSAIKKQTQDDLLSLFSQLIPATTYSPTDTLRSTIGDERLNCQVRHGTGWDPLSIITGNFMNKRLRVYLLCHFPRELLYHTL